MVLKGSTVIPENDVGRYAWNSLRKFHHVPTVVDRISSIHNLSSRQLQNARKQADQIRNCLIQAREYRDAAEANSLATKPVLMYYSIMSLALAEILLKGDGMSSLDKARGQHAHHGLELKVKPVPKGAYDLASTASALCAKPMIVGDERRGTFELWHRYAREDPLVGEVVTHNSNGGTTNAVRPLMIGGDERLGVVNPQGISLLDCFRSSPSSLSWIGQFGVQSNVVRATIRCVVNTDTSFTTSLIFHPGDMGLIDRVAEHIEMSAEAVNLVNIMEFPHGYCLEWPKDVEYISLPMATCWNEKDARFLDPDCPLNEFGYLYIGLYILGNYARYFPDLWMQDVSSGSPLALAAEYFLWQAERRMALLTFSEMTGVYQVQRV